MLNRILLYLLCERAKGGRKVNGLSYNEKFKIWQYILISQLLYAGFFLQI
jgi:hypothetical protein